jgi:hypothetical protein
MSARDNAAARDEDQMTPDQGKMQGGTNSGPTAASASDTDGAFGDAEGRHGRGGVPGGDPVDSKSPVFDRVGPKEN